MSQIAKKHLLAGIIFGDTKTQEYIYLPGGESAQNPPSVFLSTTEKKRILIWRKRDISLTG